MVKHVIGEAIKVTACVHRIALPATEVTAVAKDAEVSPSFHPQKKELAVGHLGNAVLCWYCGCTRLSC